ncbi:MAG: hypothetical protein LBV09_02495, partial [Deferribacteraceae bacterium]|nr:hypothetical protein [Deferribacteraceae bacterium]
MHLFLLLFILISTQSFAQESVNKIVADIEQYFNSTTGIVIEVEGNRAFIDIGSDKRLVNGAKLSVFHEGEPIVHPVTGKVLGSKQGTAGELNVVKVDKEFSEVTYKGVKPTVGDKVGFITPIQAKVVRDNLSDEDTSILTSILMANSTVREAKSGDYTITLKRTGDIIAYNVLQNSSKLNLIAGSITLKDREAAEKLEVVYGKELPHGRYISIAMGEFIKDNSTRYLAGALGKEIYLFDPTKDYKEIAEVEGKFGQILNIEAADLDKDGVDELFVSNFADDAVASKIYKHDGKKFVEIQQGISLLFRSVTAKDGARQILTQKITDDGEYLGEIHYLAYKDGTYIEGAAIAGSLGKRLLGFSILDELLINIGKGSRLSISTAKKLEYNAPDYYGDTFNMLEVTTTKGSGARIRPDADE